MFQVLFVAALAQSALPVAPSQEPWPTNSPGRILSTPDWSDYRIYPEAALEKEQEGRVVPELLIGKDGVPKACRIVVSSKFAELDSGTCDLMLKMRFEPARDAAGAPIPSHFERATIWGLTDPRPFASSSLRVRLAIADGAVKRCDVVGGEGPYVAFWSGLACSVYGDVGYYFPSRRQGTLAALVDVRLDAGDNAPFLKEPWISGDEIAAEKIAFTINNEGDASACAPIETHGLGSRGLNNLSPCERLLSGLWFESSPPGAATRKGLFETRVTVVRDEPQR